MSEEPEWGIRYDDKGTQAFGRLEITTQRYSNFGLARRRPPAAAREALLKLGRCERLRPGLQVGGELGHDVRR
jgi:hypothetical protein